MRAFAADARTKAGDRGFDRGRMVREVVVDGHAVDAAAHFHAPLHVTERCERGGRLRGRHADMARGRDRGQRVHPVVIALHLPRDFADALGLRIHREALVHRHAVLGRQRLPAAVDAETLDFAPAAARQHALQRVGTAVRDDPADPRHRAHQMVELRLDRGEIREDVGVIVFEVVQHGRARR
jgi:hypothetical protein